MIKFFKENLFGCSVVFVFIMIGVTVFCVDKFNSYAAKGQGTVSAPISTDSKSIVKVTTNIQPSPTKTGLIEVKGDDTNSSFQSLDFIDEQNGWLIENKYTGAVESSKLLRTQDGGIHWDKIELQDMIIDKLKFISKSEGFAIAKTVSDSKPDAKTSTFRILHSLDGGKSWTVQYEKKMPANTVNDLWFQDASKGYALIGGVMLSTMDGGKHWSTVNFGITDFTPQRMSLTSMDKGWVIGVVEKNNQAADTSIRLIVLQTSDNGKHWNKQFEKKYTDGPIGSVGIDFINPSTGWFLTSDIATWNGELYYTTNGGTNWNKINQIKSVRPTPMELQFITPKIGWIPLNVGAGPIAGGLLFTNDSGKNFSKVGGEDDFGISSAKEIYFTSEQQGWAIGMNINHGDYIIHTTDGGKTWTQIYPKPTPVDDISFVDNEHGFGLGQLIDSQVLLATVNGGRDWQSIYSFPKTFIPNFISFTDGDNGWALGNGEENKATIYKTTDGGKNWFKINSEVFKLDGFAIIYFRIFDLNNGVIVVRGVSSMSFYSTKDGGKIWQLSSVNAAKDVNALSFTSINTSWDVDTSRQASYSINLNQIVNTKTMQPKGMVGSNMWPYAIEFLSNNTGWILVQQPPFKADSVMKLLYTSNEGKTWSTMQFPKGFNIDTIRNQLPFQFTDENHGWLLSRSGLLSTMDGGNTWCWIN